MREADDARGLPRLALDRRAAAPLRLLPGLQRRRRGDRHLGRARARAAPAAGLPARLRPVRARATPARRARPGGPHGRGDVRRARRCGRRASSSRTSTCCELYDCYTYTVLVTLEDYGFCAKGEGGPFVADGKLGPGGSLPCNTGGGQLSSYYMWGFTPLSEGVIQARGQAGERQVTEHDHVLVSGNGGVLNFHSTTILSAARGVDERASPSQPSRCPCPTRRAQPFFAGARARPADAAALRRLRDVHVAHGISRRAGPAALRRLLRRRRWSGRRPAAAATLYSFALMHQLYDQAFAAEVPYNIAVVETEEGVRLTSQVVGLRERRARDRHAARGDLRAPERRGRRSPSSGRADELRPRHLREARPRRLRDAQPARSG